MSYNDLFLNYSNLPEPLSQSEFKYYYEEMKKGNKKAREKIIKHNMRLVIREVVRKFSYLPYDIEELISVGYLGLIRSADYFDINGNSTFSNYSIKCIDSAIINYLVKEKKHYNIQSLDAPYHHSLETDSSLTIEEVIPSNDKLPDELYENKEKTENIQTIIDSLKPNQKFIIENYYGFNNSKPKTQQEIAKMLNMSQTNVSSLLKRGLKKIEHDLENKEKESKVFKKKYKRK